MSPPDPKSWSGRWAPLARAVGLSPTAPVVVALSGGADSVFLLHLVARARPRTRAWAVHVDHGLRGDESIADAEFCANLCWNLGIPLVRHELPLAEGADLEARAREGRYALLLGECRRLKIPHLLTGHHSDDALETLLQRWMRGTEQAGLAGLKARTDMTGPSPGKRRPETVKPGHGAGSGTQTPGLSHSGQTEAGQTQAPVQVLRPLLRLRREEVRRLLRDAGLPWREDSSNASPRFTRNRVRNSLLPTIQETCGEQAVENLRAFANAVENLEDNFARGTAALSWAPPQHASARRGREEALLGGSLKRAHLMALAAPLRRRALWRLLTEGTGRPPSRRLVDLLLADLSCGRCARHTLAGGWGLQLRSDRLHLQPPAAFLDGGGGSRLGHLATAITPGPDLSGARLQARLPFPDSPPPEARAGLQLALPGLVRLADGRSLSAEIVDVPPTRAAPRSPVEVELDPRDLPTPLTLRWARPGDRFHALGAPGSRPLRRFLADAGIPREDRGRVPLVFADEELIWVGGLRPCEARRVRPGLARRLRLVLHDAAAEPLPLPRATPLFGD
ncbi:MAG: tRNA lysidine(34) synthetase TilS [Planctomycetota bacterium]|nr:tRNA lysidine(34) synthetase TilS [Planctomycetota bacterium]